MQLQILRFQGNSFYPDRNVKIQLRIPQVDQVSNSLYLVRQSKINQLHKRVILDSE